MGNTTENEEKIEFFHLSYEQNRQNVFITSTEARRSTPTSIGGRITNRVSLLELLLNKVDYRNNDGDGVALPPDVLPG